MFLKKKVNRSIENYSEALRLVKEKLLCQEFVIKDGILVKPEHGTPAMKIPTELAARLLCLCEPGPGRDPASPDGQGGRD